MTARTLETATLDGAVRAYARLFQDPTQWGAEGATVAMPDGPQRRARNGRDFVLQSMYGFSFADEFDYVRGAMQRHMGEDTWQDFQKATSEVFVPRDPDVLEAELQGRLAVNPAGEHLAGRKGRVQVGQRIVGRVMKPVRLKARILRRLMRALESGVIDKRLFDRICDENLAWVRSAVRWPIYAGEDEERAAIDADRRGFEGGAGLDAIDPLPDPMSFARAAGANVTNISAESCILGLDAIADNLDEGSTAATLRLRTGAQPPDPDSAESGTLLGTLTCSDPAVNAGVDDTDGSCSATFDTISDDTSADATGTAGYGRFGATGTGADDHIDGNCGTSDVAIVLNTVSIVSGANLSITSASIGQSQGSTAT